MSFRAKYFNGYLTRAFEAEVSLEADSLSLSIEHPETLEEEHLLWNPAQISMLAAESDVMRTVLLYGSYPQQKLEIMSTEFRHNYNRHFEGKSAPLAHKGLEQLFSLAPSRILGIAAISLIVIGILYIFAVPPLVESIAMAVITPEQEQEMGKTILGSMTADDVPDNAASRTATRFYQSLHFRSEPYPIHINIVKSEVVNAFALPGGEIVVYTGILKQIKSADELAALLSHEASHVILRHTTRNLARSLAHYIMFSALIGDVSGLSAVLLNNANSIYQLGYSRSLEQQADENGFNLMRSSGRTAQGFVWLFKTLKKEEDNQQEGVKTISRYISTHPLTEDRIAWAQQHLNEHPFTGGKHSDSDRLFKQLKKEIAISEKE